MALEQEKVEEIRDWFRKDPSRMTMVAARHFGVNEQDVIEALKTEWPITELRAENFEAVMEGLQQVGLVRIFVRSAAVVMECDGNLGEASYSKTGPFFNIDGGGIDMHIMYKDITSIYALEKQSHMNPEDHTYSLQFFDKHGNSAFKIFLWQDFPKTPAAVVEKYRELVAANAVGETAGASA